MKKRPIKKLLALLLTLALLAALPVTALAFSDVPDWCSQAVSALSRRGVVNGYPDGSFRPDESISRAACAKLLAELCLPDGDAGDYLQRVANANGDYWANEYVALALSLGIGDYGMSRSSWDTAVTRIETADMAQAFYAASTMATSSTLAVDSGVAQYIGDYGSFRYSGDADDVLWMYTLGLVAGVNSDGDFEAYSTLTRGQACVVFYRMISASARVDVRENTQEQGSNNTLGSLLSGFFGSADTGNKTQQSAPESSGYSDYVTEVVRLVNVERANRGLSALTIDSSLCDAAAVRAKEICSVFSHTRPDGTSWSTAMPSKYNNVARGENIAGNYASPSAVVNAWMNSSGHRANILSESYNYIGVGYAYSGGDIYWAQLFAG